jgi:hypothetical protein
MNAHLFIGSTSNKDGKNIHHGRRRQRRRPGRSIPELHNLALPPGTISHEHNSISANAYKYLVDDDGAGGAVVQSVDKVTLLPNAAKLDSATVATPALPLVETVSDDDSVLAGDDICATLADTAPMTTYRPVVWDIRVVKSNVPNAPPDPDFRKYFAFSGSSRVHQLEYAFVPETYDLSFGGARYRICRDNKLREFARVGLPNSNEGWVTLFYEQRTNGGDFTTGICSRRRGGLLEKFLYNDDSNRFFHVSKIYHRTDPNHEAIRAIAAAICKMQASTQVPFSNPFDRLNDPTLLKFEKGDGKSVFWARLKDVSPRWDIVAAPRKFLYAIEDLGRGADGRVWLTATSGGAVCVLKFSLEDRGDKLNHEFQIWKKAYPQFKVKDEKRAQMVILVRKSLITNFVAKKMRHEDVYWRNIGICTNRDGNEEAVVFDMGGVVTGVEDSSWVDEACLRLKGD